MKIILLGATGMIGAGVLIECLEDERVRSVLVLGRRPCGARHAKLRELIRSDFLHFADVSSDLADHDACLFCLGVSSAGMTEAEYSRVTYDLTVATAKAACDANPGLTFCYVSGEGTDGTEIGRSMWARVKGRTENALLRMPCPAYMFRPGFVRPMKGVRSRTRAYRVVYRVLGPAFPVLGRLFPTHVTTTVNLGRAMIRVAAGGHAKRILENADINALADEAAPPGSQADMG
jgi:uncharacterized protein YbjT (DUF2867 family)